MPPPPTLSSTFFSPSELAYLHSSLSLSPPIRPDSRSSTQFRPLVAETDILPSTNGSARICFADGTEAVVGIKAEVERTRNSPTSIATTGWEGGGGGGGDDDDEEEEEDEGLGKDLGEVQEQWVELSVEIPGFRDDDVLPIFLAEMLREGLVGAGTGTGSRADDNRGLPGRLVINRNWHWRLFIDILLLSPPLSYPLPLLSLTTHLALLSTRLPALKSRGEEDPLFDDDWAASVPLYELATTNAKKRKGKKAKKPSSGTSTTTTTTTTTGIATSSRPPVILLVICVGQNVIFDPSVQEIAVAESMIAITFAADESFSSSSSPHTEDATVHRTGRTLSLRALRMIDPPARMSQTGSAFDNVGAVEGNDNPGVWSPPRGGIKRDVVGKIVKMVLAKGGGVGEEVLDGLEAAMGM